MKIWVLIFIRDLLGFLGDWSDCVKDNFGLMYGLIFVVLIMIFELFGVFLGIYWDLLGSGVKNRGVFGIFKSDFGAVGCWVLIGIY